MHAIVIGAGHNGLVTATQCGSNFSLFLKIFKSEYSNMSHSSDNNSLNFLGQLSLASTSSLFVNGLVHPLCTIKTYRMVGYLGSMSFRRLYNGYWAVCGVDSASFSIAYTTNGLLTDRNINPLIASLAAGLLSSPFVAVGESLMANRQIHALPYSALWRRALRPAGLFLTMTREIPFTTSLFYTAPLLQKKFEFQSNSQSILNMSLSGLIAGAMAGAATAPVDLIKTRIQSSEQSFSITKTIRLVLAEGGYFSLCKGAGTRALYVGLTVAIMNSINHTLPNYMPEALHS